jgi:hypothetical protein
MKCVILAGGLGTRISEETTASPNPWYRWACKPDPVARQEDISAAALNDFGSAAATRFTYHEILRHLLPAHVGRHLLHDA